MPDGTTETPAASIRLAARRGALHEQMSRFPPGFVQANVAILPADHAAEFGAFRTRNFKACQVLARSEPGDPSLPAIGHDIDTRRSQPRYYFCENGKVAAALGDIGVSWTDDPVTLAIDYSFTFEHTLLEAGVRLRHAPKNCNLGMYHTSIDTYPDGRFGGKVVVSMRPFLPDGADRAEAIPARIVDAHGWAVHRGDQAAIGSHDLAAPDYGYAVNMAAGELPIFWARGVTTQSALQRARLPFFLAHAPRCMLATNLCDSVN